MNLFDRLRDALGFGEEYDEFEDYDAEEGMESDYEPAHSASRKLPNNVIGLPGLMMEVVLMQPRTFDEAPQAVTALRERKSVVLNLTLMDPEQAQRCADYVAGGAFAIDGNQRQLGPNIFLFTPNFVQISSYTSADPAATHVAHSLSNAGNASGASPMTWTSQSSQGY
ncbi:MAG: cell division protein SepF [Synechococcales cyanobacterium M58_A2018_015]|nr:cell division protein SepF [Synechococcales cyanobacterium M58_A2018_015]